MINIMLADDHALLRSGLKRIIASEADLQVTYEAKNSEEVLQIINNESVDILILDINMPGRSGLDILPVIKNMRPEMPILILSINPEDQFARRCLNAGASGYMNKDIEPEEFLSAIRKIAKGQKYFSPAFIEMLLSEMDCSNNDKVPHDSLTDRELEVLRMIAKKKKYTEISQELSISIKTVSAYRARIMGKLKLCSTDEMIRYAINNQLVY